MANSTLFASSLCLAFLHLALVLAFQPVPRVFAFVILCGTFSSIWNHGVTNDIAKWADRCMMAIGACADLAYLSNVPIQHRPLLVALIAAAIIGYVGAKYLVVTAAAAKAAPRAASPRGKAPLPASAAASGNLPHLIAHVLLSSTHFIMIMQLSAYCGSPSQAANAGAFCA